MLVPTSEHISKNEVANSATALCVTDWAMPKNLPPRLVNTPKWAADARAKLKAMGRTPAWLTRELSRRLPKKVSPSVVSRMLNNVGHSTYLIAPTCEILGISAPDPIETSAVDEPDSVTIPGDEIESYLDAAVRALRTIYEINPEKYSRQESKLLAMALTLSEEERKKQ